MKYEKNYYKILDVGRNATQDEIKHAFRRLAKQYHPDAGKCRNANIFIELEEAYHLLSDPREREKYDWDYFGSCKKYDYRKEPQAEHQRVHVKKKPYVEPGPAARYSSTESKLREQVRSEPESVSARYRLAHYLITRKKRYIEAERLLLDIIGYEWNDEDIIYDLAIAKYYLGEYEDAENLFRQCLVLDPENGEAFSCLSYILFNEDMEMGIEYLLSNPPENAKENYLYWLMLGEYNYSNKEFKYALSDLKYSLKLNPRSARGHSSLAKCLWALGMKREATAYFEKALSLEPRNLSTAAEYGTRIIEGRLRVRAFDLPAPDEIEIIDRRMRIRYNQNAMAVTKLCKNDMLLTDVAVLEGSTVDMLFMAETEFRKYARNKPYEYNPRGTRLDTKNVSATIWIPETKKYCLIVENSFLTPGGVNPNIADNFGSVLARVQMVICSPGGSIIKGLRKTLGSFGNMLSKGFLPSQKRKIDLRLF